MTWAAAIAVGFLIGSIPFGFIIARLKGVDIRRHGSGNIGATNVGRVLGRRLGMTCFVLDVCKGLAPTLGAGVVLGVAGRYVLVGADAWWWLAVMASPVLGHMFSPWIGFKGGKGVATGFGALLGVFPILTWAVLGAFAVWVVVTLATRYVGLASSVAAVAIPIFVAVEFLLLGRMESATPFLVVTGLVAALVLYKHRGNLARLMRGEESKIGSPKEPV
jgi:glycerol-3-phosphate acyltransferase PlsY